MRRVLLYFAIKYKGDFKKIYQAILDKESVSQDKLDSVERLIKCKFITVIDKEYPRQLHDLTCPPFVLFYYGNLKLIDDISYNMVGVIGKREASDYGKMCCINIVKGLKEYNSIVVSGLAVGNDCVASQTAIDNNIPTIVVLGSGIDNCYPPSNKSLYNQIKEKGLILSEYPNDLTPEPENFLNRNRIIAALSDKIVVIEANKKSGTMNTVGYGLELGKDIYAIPYHANTDSGCNMLIKEGAKLIENADDIFD